MVKHPKEKVLNFDGDVVFIAYDEMENLLEEAGKYRDKTLTQYIRTKCTEVEGFFGNEDDHSLIDRDTKDFDDEDFDDFCLYTECDTLFILSLEDYIDILKKLDYDVEEFVEPRKKKGYRLNSLNYDQGDTYCPIFALKNFKGTIKVYYDFEWEYDGVYITGVPKEYRIEDDGIEFFRLADVDGIDKVTGKEIHYILV